MKIQYINGNVDPLVREIKFGSTMSEFRSAVNVHYFRIHSGIQCGQALSEGKPRTLSNDILLLRPLSLQVLVVHAMQKFRHLVIPPWNGASKEMGRTIRITFFRAHHFWNHTSRPLCLQFLRQCFGSCQC